MILKTATDLKYGKFVKFGRKTVNLATPPHFHETAQSAAEVRELMSTTK